MELQTKRFGPVQIEPSDVIRFPAGVLGLENCRDWVLLADAQTDSLAWLQSVDRLEIAFAVVSPRRFVPGYQMRVARRELEPLALNDIHEAGVLVILSRIDQTITVNLKAPLVLNLDRRLGRQVIANGPMPIQHELGSLPSALRKIA